MNGQLFSQDFLLGGIQTTPVWAALSDNDLNSFADSMHRVFAPYSLASVLNEAITEDEIVLKVLALLQAEYCEPSLSIPLKPRYSDDQRLS